MSDLIQDNLSKAIRLCDEHKFGEAEPVLQGILSDNPNLSDAWRLLAVVDWYGNNNLDKAENDLIESLRLDQTNTQALLQMGNLLALKKGDLKAAKAYYEKILEYHPNDAIAMNNIGGVCMKNRRYDEAIDWFQRAMNADSTFPNSYYAMALCFKAQTRNITAFNVCVDGMVKGKDRPENPNVMGELEKLMFQQSAILYAMSPDFSKLIETFRKEMEDYDGHPVRLVMDNNIQDDFILEYRPWFHRNETIIKAHNEKFFSPYSIIHAFMRLERAIAATKADRGKVIIINDNNDMDRLLVSNIIRLPLDLLAQDLLYELYPGQRYVQVMALNTKAKECISMANGKGNTYGLSKSHMETYRILSLVSAMHLRQLYGIDDIDKYHPGNRELNEAQELYRAYKACKEHFTAGDEYQLVEEFAKQLGVADCIAFKDEFSL